MRHPTGCCVHLNSSQHVLLKSTFNLYTFDRKPRHIPTTAIPMTSLTCLSRAFAGFNRDRLMDVFTDVTFRIANTGETLGAHSAVLGSLSPWIAQYRDQITCSCSSKPCCHDKPHLDIVLVGYDAFTVEKMLETVYTGQAQVNVATATAIEQLGSSLGLRLAASLYPDEALRVSTPGQEPLESGSVAIRPLIQVPEYEIKMETDPLAMPAVDIDEFDSYSLNPKKSGFKCFQCQEVHKSSTKLKFHLCRTHFKTALIDKYQDNTGECDICGYIFADVASTAMHLGLKHDKIRDFVSKDDQPEIYCDQEKNVSLQSMIFEDEQFALSMLRKTLNQTNHPMDLCNICMKSRGIGCQIKTHLNRHFGFLLLNRREWFEDLKCGICSTTHSSKFHLTYHLGFVHKKFDALANATCASRITFLD